MGSVFSSVGGGRAGAGDEPQHLDSGEAASPAGIPPEWDPLPPGYHYVYEIDDNKVMRPAVYRRVHVAGFIEIGTITDGSYLIRYPNGEIGAHRHIGTGIIAPFRAPGGHVPRHQNSGDIYLSGELSIEETRRYVDSKNKFNEIFYKDRVKHEELIEDVQDSLFAVPLLSRDFTLFGNPTGLYIPPEGYAYVCRKDAPNRPAVFLNDNGKASLLVAWKNPSSDREITMTHVVGRVLCHWIDNFILNLSHFEPFTAVAAKDDSTGAWHAFSVSDPWTDSITGRFCAAEMARRAQATDPALTRRDSILAARADWGRMCEISLQQGAVAETRAQ